MSANPQQKAALQALLKYADEWLRKHPKPRDAAERARIDLIDSIRAEAGVEYAKAQASATYMGDGRAALPCQAAGAERSGSQPVQEVGARRRVQEGVDVRTSQRNVRRLHQRRGRGWQRNELVASGELQALAPGADDALRAGIESLSPAEYAAIHTYTGKDYEYMNKNVGDWAGRPGRFGGDVVRRWEDLEAPGNDRREDRPGQQGRLRGGRTPRRLHCRGVRQVARMEGHRLQGDDVRRRLHAHH